MEQIVNKINNLLRDIAGDDDIISKWLDDETQQQLLDIVKNKKLKDPDAPKGACSSYIFFCRRKRESVKEENPEMNGKDITRELGRRWGELSEKKKAKYIKEAEEDKKRYKKEMEEYEPPSEEELKEKQPKKRKMSTKVKKERNGPKRPTTSFLYFSKDMRQQVKDENPEMTGRDVTKELGRLWREDYADDESREKWVKLYQKDKERYESEKSDNSESDDKHSDSEDKSKKIESKAKEKSKKIESKAKETECEEEERVDEDGTYIPRKDNWYIGEIPDNCSREQLETIIVKGLKKFIVDEKKYTGNDIDTDKLCSVIDYWFEKNEKMDSVIEEVEMDGFVSDVLTKMC